MTRDDDGPDLTKLITPFGLKMIVDSADKYQKAYKSYAFGLVQKIKSKWLLLLVLGIVAVVVLLYLTGAISFR